MIQIIPNRKQNPWGEMASNAMQGIDKGVEAYQKGRLMQEENDALEKRGIFLKGIRDPDTRSQIISQELQYGRKINMAKKSYRIKADLFNRF